jgi:hypothetical protein
VTVSVRCNDGLGAGVALVGATECDATQTWQPEEFSSFEWRCETTASADQIISNTQSHAIHFENELIMADRECVVSMYTETRDEANEDGSASFPQVH